MKVSELREKTLPDLRALVREESGKLLHARLSVKGGQLKQHHTVRALRRQVAKIKTVITEKRGQVNE